MQLCLVLYDEDEAMNDDDLEAPPFEGKDIPPKRKAKSKKAFFSLRLKT